MAHRLRTYAGIGHGQWSVPGTVAAVASVTVSPSSPSITAGATQQMAATVRDASGNILTGRTVTWSSSNTAVATVNGSGVASGVAAGGPVTITATSEGVSGTASLTVTAAAAVTAWRTEDFSTYTSDANFKSDPRGIYDEFYDGDSGNFILDQTVGYNGRTQSMRFRFPGQGLNTGSAGAEVSPGRILQLPSATKHFWAEFYIRTSANFKTDWRTEINNTSKNPDYKWLFLEKGQAKGRWQIKMGFGATNWQLGPSMTGDATATYQNGVDTNNDGIGEGYYDEPCCSNNLWTNAWERVRVEAKMGTGDGILRLWMGDGATPHYSRTDLIADDATGFTGIFIGRNLNIQPAETMYLWTGLVNYYNTNPGW